LVGTNFSQTSFSFSSDKEVKGGTSELSDSLNEINTRVLIQASKDAIIVERIRSRIIELQVTLKSPRFNREINILKKLMGEEYENI